MICDWCDFSHSDFVEKYGDQPDKLIELVQPHDLILKKMKCPKCKDNCNLDLKVMPVGQRFKKIPCNFKTTIFKGTWFSNDKFDVKTNFLFINLSLKPEFNSDLAKLVMKQFVIGQAFPERF